MKNFTEGQHNVTEWNSLSELVSYLKTHKPTIGSYAAVAGHEFTSTFLGTATNAEAYEMAENGWPAGAKMVADAVATAPKAKADKAQAKRTTYSYAVAGDECDVARHCQGDIENMRESRTRIVRGKTVRKVFVSCNFSSDVPGPVLERYAIAVAACVTRLEKSGKRVELWAIKSNAHPSVPGYTLETRVRIKTSESRMHPAQLAFVAHPAFIRRILWGPISLDAKLAHLTKSGGNQTCSVEPCQSGNFITKAKVMILEEQAEAAIRELQTVS